MTLRVRINGDESFPIEYGVSINVIDTSADGNTNFFRVTDPSQLKPGKKLRHITLGGLSDPNGVHRLQYVENEFTLDPVNVFPEEESELGDKGLVYIQAKNGFEKWIPLENIIKPKKFPDVMINDWWIEG